MRRLLPLLAMLFLFGCGPTVGISPPAYSNVKETGEINFTVTNHHDRAGKPVILLFPKYQPVNIQNLSDNLTEVKPGEYTLTLPKLAPDVYRIVMELPYTLKLAGISFGTSVQRSYAEFSIHQVLPDSCFRFDNENKDLMGWTSHGVYINNRESR